MDGTVFIQRHARLWFQPTPFSMLTPAASEPLRTTLTRAGIIALTLGTVASLAGGEWPRSPESGLGWLLHVLSVFWFSFGGHWVELLYLRWLLPLFTHGSASSRLAARWVVWYAGGAMLWPCAVATQTLLAAGRLPSPDEVAQAAYWGGLGFIAVQLAAHSVLYALGWPSAWRARRGRIG